MTQKLGQRIDLYRNYLWEVKGVFKSCDLQCWLIGGTFLGIYRDGDLIPYDDDIDLAIKYEDSLKLFAALIELVKFDFRIRLNVGKNMIILTRDGVKIDLCMFWLKGDKRCWGQYEIDDKDFGDKAIKYIDRKFNILSNPEKWLRYSYGDDWKVPIEDKSVGLGKPFGC